MNDDTTHILLGRGIGGTVRDSQIQYDRLGSHEACSAGRAKNGNILRQRPGGYEAAVAVLSWQEGILHRPSPKPVADPSPTTASHLLPIARPTTSHPPSSTAHRLCCFAHHPPTDRRPSPSKRKTLDGTGDEAEKMEKNDEKRGRKGKLGKPSFNDDGELVLQETENTL